MLSVALALGAVLPGAGAALAQEPDQEREGAAAPELTPPDSTADPDFNPGGETGLPFNVDLRGGGGGDDAGNGAPVDAEPETDPDALAVPLDDSTATEPNALDGADEPIAPAEAPAPPAPAPQVAAPPPVSPPVATIPEAENQQRAGDRSNSRATRSAERKRKRERSRQQRPAAVRVTLPAAAVAQPAPVDTTTAQAPVEATAPPKADNSGPPPSLGNDTHTVRRGESLWTIASDLLGNSATVSEIAAESNRIYNLNRDRIGDDPDVLIIGTVLRLR
jgi:hypothetical protein